MTVELSMPEVQTDHPETAELSKPQLRMVDLNLLTVFDAVMQEQNITRAAHALGMSGIVHSPRRRDQRLVAIRAGFRI